MIIETYQIVCPSCKGSGTILQYTTVGNICPACNGARVVTVTRTISNDVRTLGPQFPGDTFNSAIVYNNTFEKEMNEGELKPEETETLNEDVFYKEPQGLNPLKDEEFVKFLKDNNSYEDYVELSKKTDTDFKTPTEFIVGAFSWPTIDINRWGELNEKWKGTFCRPLEEPKGEDGIIYKDPLKDDGRQITGNVTLPESDLFD